MSSPVIAPPSFVATIFLRISSVSAASFVSRTFKASPSLSGTSILEMGEAHGLYQPMPTMFYLYVPDVDATYARAIAAGAHSASEPGDQPYGDRTASVKDAFGHVWYLATHVRDVTG